GAGLETCRAHLPQLLLTGFHCLTPDTGLPLFAFRLPQFVSRGDAVYGTVEPPSSRELYMEGQVYAAGGREKRLFPMAFCRECGQEFFVVDLHKNASLIPRELRAISREDEVTSGYMMPDPEEQLVGDPDGRLDLQGNDELLPEDWLETGKGGE